MNLDVVKPREGWSIGLGRILLCVNWARTWTWAETNEENKQRTIKLLSVEFLQREMDNDDNGYVLKIIIVPLLIHVGWWTKGGNG